MTKSSKGCQQIVCYICIDNIRVSWRLLIHRWQPWCITRRMREKKFAVAIDSFSWNTNHVTCLLSFYQGKIAIQYLLVFLFVKISFAGTEINCTYSNWLILNDHTKQNVTHRKFPQNTDTDTDKYRYSFYYNICVLCNGVSREVKDLNQWRCLAEEDVYSIYSCYANAHFFDAYLRSTAA